MTQENLGSLTRRRFLRNGIATTVGLGAGLNLLSGLEARANSLFVELNDENYKSEILDYEGAALVLFYDGNFERAPPSRRMFRVFEALAREYTNKPVERLNRKPIKFGVYNIAPIEDLPISKEEKFKRTEKYSIIAFPTTVMYIKGEDVDRLRGGPTDNRWVEPWVKYLNEKWISTNITNPNGQFYWRFNNTGSEQKVLYSS